jgi:hypothetical protein
MGATFTTTTVYPGAGWKDRCRNAGYDDGQNEPFSQGTYDHCGEKKVAMMLTMVSLTVASLWKAMQETLANLQQTDLLP